MTEIPKTNAESLDDQPTTDKVDILPREEAGSRAEQEDSAPEIQKEPTKSEALRSKIQKALDHNPDVDDPFVVLSDSETRGVYATLFESKLSDEWAKRFKVEDSLQEQLKNGGITKEAFDKKYHELPMPAGIVRKELDRKPFFRASEVLEADEINNKSEISAAEAQHEDAMQLREIAHNLQEQNPDNSDPIGKLPNARLRSAIHDLSFEVNKDYQDYRIGRGKEDSDYSVSEMLQAADYRDAKMGERAEKAQAELDADSELRQSLGK